MQKAMCNPEEANYRFSTWGEFNEGYLMFLSEEEQKQYWNIAFKFGLIHNDYRAGRNVPTLHDGDLFGYRDELTKRLEELKNWKKLQ